MRVLGIDPGTMVMGFGIVQEEDGDIAAVDYGVLTPPARSSIGERLKFIYDGLLEVIRCHRPEIVAVEQPFVSKNVRSALAIGQAQAVALLAAAGAGLPAHQYTPAQIKQSVANYGASRKEQVQEMVRLQLGLPQAPEPADAADALAVAICHLREIHLANLLARQ